MKRIIFIAALALGTAVCLTTQPAEAATEAYKARKAELKEAKKLLKDDEKDLKKLAKIVDGWNTAWEDGKHDKETKWDRKLVSWIESERAENRDAIEDTREDIAEAPGGRARNIEQEQLEQEQNRNRRTREIISELTEVHRKFQPTHVAKRPAHVKKSELLKALLKAARFDVKLRKKNLTAAEKRMAKAKAAK